MKHVANSLSRPQIVVEAPIKEDEEEQNDQATLLAADKDRDLVRKHNKSNTGATSQMALTMPVNQT